MKLNSNQKIFIEHFILFLLIIVSLFFWNSIFLFPIKLFVVLLHELSHGIATIITGGKILELNIDSSLSGKCITQDDNQLLIASFGYPGSFIFGSLIFYSTYNKNIKTFLILFISIIIFLFAVNTIKDQYYSFISILFGFILLVITKYLPDFISNLILRLIGLISCLYVIYDIKEDVFNNKNFLSDAALISELSGLPSTLWGFIWIFISLIGMFFLIKSIIKKIR